MTTKNISEAIVFYAYPSECYDFFKTTSFLYSYNDPIPPKPTLTKIVYNNPHTVVFWSDNTQTKAVCLPEDRYSAKRGLFVCRMKKKYGSWSKYQEAKQNKKADKEMRKLLKRAGRQIELANALVIKAKL